MTSYLDIKNLESGFYKICDASIVRFGGKIGFKIININDDNSCVFVQLHPLKEKRTPGEKISSKDINEGFNVCLCFDNVKSIDSFIGCLNKAKQYLNNCENNNK